MESTRWTLCKSSLSTLPFTDCQALAVIGSELQVRVELSWATRNPGDHLNQRHGAGGRFTNPPFLPFSNFQGTTSIAQHHLGPAKSHIYHTGTSIWQMFGYWWNATTATNCWSPALARLVIVCNFDNFLSGESGRLTLVVFEDWWQFVWQFCNLILWQHKIIVEKTSNWTEGQSTIKKHISIAEHSTAVRKLFKSMTEKNLHGLKDLKHRNETQHTVRFLPLRLTLKLNKVGCNWNHLNWFHLNLPARIVSCSYWRRVEVGQSEKGPFLFSKKIADDCQYYKM